LKIFPHWKIFEPGKNSSGLPKFKKIITINLKPSGPTDYLVIPR
jgi:hypothetical protein